MQHITFYYVTIRFNSRYLLIEHLNRVHDAQIYQQKHEFGTWSDFEMWKTEEESRTKSSYVRDSSAKVYGKSKYYYFYCNDLKDSPSTAIA